MTRIIECPHCCTRIIPKLDRTCPACQNDTADTRGTDPSRTSLHVTPGSTLPAICCDCGGRADLYVVVRRYSAGESEMPSGFGQALIALFISMPLAAYFLLRGIDNRSVVQIQMPQCQRCTQRAAPQPKYVDFANARMTFIVHKNLKQALDSQGAG